MKTTELQIETSARNIFGGAAFVESYGFGEFKVYTECWSIEAKDLNKFLSATGITLNSIYVDGGFITLSVKS